MIVVVGPVPEVADSRLTAESVARRVARKGGAVEVVSVVVEGPAGDRILARLAEAGIRHAATLRSAAAGLDAADLELALRYLPEIRVIVLGGDGQGLRPAAVRAAAWSGATLVTLAIDGPASDADAPAGTSGTTEIVLQGPTSDPDGAFAGLVAELALRLDAGEPPAAAWRHVTDELGVDGVRPRTAPSGERRQG